MNTLQNFWFLLKSTTYISFDKQEVVLLYNTQKGTHFETANQQIIALIKSAQEKLNLGVCLLNGELLTDADFSEIIQQLVEFQLIELLEIDKSQPKPISLLPVLNLQKDIEKLRKDKSRSIGEGALSYLTNLNLYINSVCEQKCNSCAAFYRQIPFCTKQNVNAELSMNCIENILQQISASSVGRINVFGGNVLLYSKLQELPELFQQYGVHFHFWIYYQNLSEKIEIIDNFHKDILLAFPLENDFENIFLNLRNEKTTFHFVIENEAQYIEFERFKEKYGHLNFQAQPFFNGGNIDFFRENVFLNKEDIFADTVPLRTIFCNQKLNSNFFGKLFVLPDGSVRANLNAEILGNIKEKSLLELISKELNTNTAWRKTRNETPCNECMYQYFCPPPSNYEIATEKYYLCNIK
ncbi:hypothetical protein FACS189429_6290 [Bacteroidia bacterium]|nr:hypothetical protein FACS189429_6290 [Bacteroidia bacterium]GHV44321.1 hypothetical protein FACS1894180_5510 [Bacteroidia bacterium]